MSDVPTTTPGEPLTAEERQIRLRDIVDLIGGTAPPNRAQRRAEKKAIASARRRQRRAVARELSL